MAKLHEEIFLIKISQLLKDVDNNELLLTQEMVEALEAFLSELVNKNSVLVEIERCTP